MAVQTRKKILITGALLTIIFIGIWIHYIKRNQNLQSRNESNPNPTNIAVTTAKPIPEAPPKAKHPSTEKAVPKPNQEIQETGKAPHLKELLEGCYQMTYVHKKIDSHASGEKCLHHRNLLSLTYPDPSSTIGRVNPKSICVKVNGRAVKAKLVGDQSNQVLIAPEAGPHAKISVRYCLGKSQCHEDCIIQNDEFLSALGVDSEQNSDSVDWDGSKGSSKEDIELEDDVNQLSGKTTKSSAEGDSKAIFDGWIEDSHDVACTHLKGGNGKEKKKAR